MFDHFALLIAVMSLPHFYFSVSGFIPVLLKKVQVYIFFIFGVNINKNVFEI